MGDFSLAVAFTVGPLTVRWYGVLICTAMLLGMALAYKEAQRQHVDTDHLLNILLLLIPSAIIGARLWYVLFNLKSYIHNPAKIFATWEGGLAIHGGIILVCLAMWLYCRKKEQSFLRWADILAPSLVLGQAIGRWGNFANVEAYGNVIPEGSFWSWIPMQVWSEGAYHHPTFLYESIWDLLVFITLMILIRKPHRIGSIFADYVIFYSIGRFFIEGLRTDSLMIGSIRTAQLVSALGICLGVFILWRLEKKPVVDVAKAEPAKPAPGVKKKKKRNR